MFELFWDVFWIVMAVIVWVNHGPMFLIVLFFALAGVIWFDPYDLL